MALVSPPMDSAAYRLLRRTGKAYSDFTGTTAGSANTAGLVAHNLVDDVGRPLVPSRVEVFASASTPAGFVYEQAAGHTAVNADIRATGASVAYRARAWA